MITIGQIPRKTRSFFNPVRNEFSRPGFNHFCRLVLAMTISHGSTIQKLVERLRYGGHRTNHGEFLWRSQWDESWVIRQIALDTLRRLYRKDAGPCYLILDDTQTLKRAKKMQAVGKLFHHATGKYGQGHTIVKASLHYRGVTLPWASMLYLKTEHAETLELPFLKLTQMAAMIIRNATLPPKLNVIVLFDAFYLCRTVTQACRDRRWHYISVGKSNRNFVVHGVRRKLGRYGHHVLRRAGRSVRIKTRHKSATYRLAARRGTLHKLGVVNVVFSRRAGQKGVTALVTDDLSLPMKTVVAEYLKRWSIELLIKDEKQHLGLADYRVLRYQAVVRHLHLVDAAYACLTHMGIKAQRAQGQNKNNRVLRLEPISRLKSQMRQMFWQEAVEHVIKYSHEKPVIRRLEKLLAA